MYVLDGAPQLDDFADKDWAQRVEYQWSVNEDDYAEHRLTVFGDTGKESRLLAQRICALLNDSVVDWTETWRKLGDDMPCPNCGEEQIESQDGVTACYACDWHADNPVMREAYEEDDDD